jgi:integral membrane protein
MLHLLKTTIGRFRVIAFMEGISYLILLFIAVPLKYVWGQPLAVRVLGSAHGFLFVLYILYAFLCKIEYRWSAMKTVILLGISVIPFGNFYADGKYLKTEN